MGSGSEYWAHSANPDGKLHDLRKHLLGVAELARRFAEPIGAGEWAYTAGLWHDLGKFSAAFQQYLQGASSNDAHVADIKGGIDHASAGAQHAANTFKLLGHLIAFVIAGHHSGLLDAISDGACLDRRLHKAVESWQHGLALLPEPKPPELPRYLREALSRRSKNSKAVSFSFAFFTRMIYSCVVDADFLDTEAFLNSESARARASWPADMLALMEQALEEFVGNLPAEDSPVVRQRQRVREACLLAAEKPPGLFSLTVPTGGGKTLSSLAFALKHAIKHDLRRIVYVAPFTTIIEQNAVVFRRVFAPLMAVGFLDPVVEHHSALDVREESLVSRLAAENWDAPMIVTTSVQFYESLFADRASRCRKLHNIARAVIILDEVQKLPVDYLSACLSALHELASNYGATVVLCTATQPAIQRRPDFPIGLSDVREIVSEPGRLYTALKRVEVSDLGALSDEELAERLSNEKQALCIVNTRRHARELYERMQDQYGIIHLSAAMCPIHRAQVVNHVRALLEKGEPCRVISTQLVEAGIDLDFPVVYRSLAGIDSIAQAAGRCNRNGRLPQGFTYLFRSEHGRSEAFLRDTTNITTQLINSNVESKRLPYLDLLSPEAVEKYFKLYYWNQQQRWDACGILEQFDLANNQHLPFLFSFKSAAEKFHIIENTGRPVIVPWGKEGKQLCEELRRPRRVPIFMLLRALQSFTVQSPVRTWQAEIGRAIELVHDQFAVLVAPDIYYNERLGLLFERDRIESESLVI